MTMFTKMLEIMRTRGYVVTLPGAKIPSDPSGRLGPAKWTEELPREMEWDLFQKCEPFVFSANQPFNNTNDAQTAAMSWEPGFDKNDKIDAPFPVFSVEYLNGEPLDFFLMANGERRETVGIIVVEIQPKQYGYYALCHDYGDPREPYKVFKSNTEGTTVEKLLQRLRTEKMGIETVRQNVKLGTGKLKRFHRIRRIVHVSPRKILSGQIYDQRTIDWSHRWEVRGHWRKHEGLGKDRAGDYCVNGFTWVVNYEKGPDHLPLVPKTRLVKD